MTSCDNLILSINKFDKYATNRNFIMLIICLISFFQCLIQIKFNLFLSKKSKIVHYQSINNFLSQTVTLQYMNTLKCVLHSANYQYFCQRCNQPICRQCTLIGPHNTQIHRIVQISIAYQLRINQIRDRISQLMNGFRSKILHLIDQQNATIEQTHKQKKIIEAQNAKYKTKLLQNLIQTYEHNTHQINTMKEQITSQLNQMNDKGHHYENLNSDLQLVTHHEQIINQFKQEIDRIEILLQRKVAQTPLPRQQTNIRLAINKLQSLQALYTQKLNLLSSILNKSKSNIQKIEKPEIPYELLLNQLNNNINENQDHYVCHFCGQTFSFQICNDVCPLNKVSMNIVSSDFKGYCNQDLQSTRFGTHRHYFGKPKNQLFHFKQYKGSFKVHVNSILLKLRTLIKLNKVKLQSELKSNDEQKKGLCQRIVMQYCLIELSKLSQKQAQILMRFCQNQKQKLYQYPIILNKLQQIDIDM